jgi:hypothetical protein
MRLAKWAKLFAMNARNPGVSKEIYCPLLDEEREMKR